MPKPSAVSRLHALLDVSLSRFKGYLPHENAQGEFHSSNPHLSPSTRTVLAFIEDQRAAADAIIKEDLTEELFEAAKMAMEEHLIYDPESKSSRAVARAIYLFERARQ